MVMVSGAAQSVPMLPHSYYYPTPPPHKPRLCVRPGVEDTRHVDQDVQVAAGRAELVDQAQHIAAHGRRQAGELSGRSVSG